MRARNLASFLLIAAVLLLSASCKRSPQSVVVVERKPRIAPPTTQERQVEIHNELLAQFDPVPDLGQGTDFRSADGEVWVKYPCGIMTHDIKPSLYQSPKLGQELRIAYVGTFANSTRVFDKRSVDNPLVFQFGTKRVIKGLNMGLSNMPVYGKRRIYIPPEFAYGVEGDATGDIPANQALIFEVELLSITGEELKSPPSVPSAKPAGPTLEEPRGSSAATMPTTAPPP